MRSIGIDPGDQAVKVVELDGSYKKTRLLRVHVAPAGAPGADGGTRVDVVAATARAALDEGMRGVVSLGHPCREAVLRTLELPFKGHDAIRKVVKSEIEGEIQSQSVDDMVVDFHEIGEGSAGGTRVLVAAVPKAGLRAQLDALAAHAVEADQVDLDTMALWRAADWVGVFAAEDADDATGAAPRITAVLDLGARSVKVLLVEGDRLIEMRALRLGDGVVADDVARRHGIDTAIARDAVRAVLRSGADQRIDVPAAVPALPEGAAAAPATDEAAAPAPARAVVVRWSEVEAAHAAYLQRLARELTRFLTASGRAAQLGAVWVTGGAVRARGTQEMLTAVFGVEARELDVLGRLQHELTQEEVEEHGSRLTTAIGIALGKLGGPEGFQLRQEDLVLTRGFERVKFPLAIACMVGLLAMFVYWQKKQAELQLLEYEIGRTFVSKEKKTPLQFYGMLNTVLGSGWFDKPEQFRIVRDGKDYTHNELKAEIAAAPVHRRLTLVRDRLKEVVTQKQRESAIFDDISIESGLAVLVRWSEMMLPVEPQLGRYLVTKIDLDMKARRLEFTVAFRTPDFRTRAGVLQAAIDAELQKADSPFIVPQKADSSRKTEDLFKDIAESGVEGAYCHFTMHLKDTFAPFGPSANKALGAASTPALRAGGSAAKNEVAATEGK
jgi:Tfp pilus assembly PilM family ATPase